MKKCKNEKKLRSYDKERDIEVYRADDCIDRYGDCDSTGHHELRCNNVKMQQCKNVKTSGFYAKPEGFCIPDKVNALFDSKMHLYGTVIAWQLFVEFDPAAPAGCLVEC